jgi:SAM-dependent methyltransferase
MEGNWSVGPTKLPDDKEMRIASEFGISPKTASSAAWRQLLRLPHPRKIVRASAEFLLRGHIEQRTVAPKKSLVNLMARSLVISQMYPLALVAKVRATMATEECAKARFRQKALWYSGIVNELDWWRDYLLNDPVGRQWQIDSQNPALPVTDPFVLQHIARETKTEVRIIDVGAGPITKLGYEARGKVLKITPVDPLAKHYDTLLRRNGILLPVPTIQGDGEHLLQQFSARSFDLAYACNALDHSYDPLAVMQNMIHLVRPGGHVLLRHFRNEAEAGRYHGLHQWNFDCRDGRFVVWQPNSLVDVGNRFDQEVEIACSIEEAGLFDDWNECILVSMKVH